MDKTRLKIIVVLLSIFSVCLAGSVGSTDPALIGEGANKARAPQGSEGVAQEVCDLALQAAAAHDPGTQQALREIAEFQRQAHAAERKILLSGGYIPEVLRKVQPGDELSFNDGAVFRVGTQSYPLTGFVNFEIESTHDLQSGQLNEVTSSQNGMELVMAGYSGESPGLGLLTNGVLTQHPRESLVFLRENEKELRELVPIRRFLKISEDGIYAIAEKIPPYKGTLMTGERFLSDKSLTLEERQFLAGRLEEFFVRAVDIYFNTLNVPQVLAFDPRDNQWKFLMLDRRARRHYGDNFILPFLTDIETGLYAGRYTEAEADFFSGLWKRWDALKLRIELTAQSTAGERAKADKEKRLVSYSGIYEFEISLNSGEHLTGTLDTTSFQAQNGADATMSIELLGADRQTAMRKSKSIPPHSFDIRRDRVNLLFGDLFADMNLKTREFYLSLFRLAENESKEVPLEGHLLDERGISHGWGALGRARIVRVK